MPTHLSDELLRAEALLSESRAEEAVILLATLAEDAEEYVDRNCQTTESVQYFAFPSLFERLAYRRVEDDPRELRDVGEPLDRLYADLGFALVARGDYARATESLKRAVRWNPMGCGYRLDLAELFRTNGDVNEWLGLTHSVFSRASDVRHLARAYANFARYFGDTGQLRLQAAALRCGLRLGVDDGLLISLTQSAQGTEADPSKLTDDEASELMEAEGIPEGANAEIAVCLLMCATDAAALGDRNLATNLTLRARDLVGEAAAKALLQLIHESDTGGAQDSEPSASQDNESQLKGGE